jgi:hypothetical protein
MLARNKRGYIGGRSPVYTWRSVASHIVRIRHFQYIDYVTPSERSSIPRQPGWHVKAAAGDDRLRFAEQSIMRAMFSRFLRFSDRTETLSHYLGGGHIDGSFSTSRPAVRRHDDADSVLETD